MVKFWMSSGSGFGTVSALTEVILRFSCVLIVYRVTCFISWLTFALLSPALCLE